jgi:lactose/cellobiose-specific phosphotransferase system IIC component
VPDLLVRRHPRLADCHRHHEPVLDGKPVGKPGGTGCWAALHVYLQGFWDHYLLIGGVGSTLPLAFLLLRSRVTHLRTIGKMGVVPSFFNINEPILFGAPIIMNPMLFIPFVCVPLVNACLAYGATKLGWLAQVVSLTPWTTPAPIGASWAANWALSPVVMCRLYGDVRADVPAVPACL